jgi:hypothetical protein
MKTSTQASVQFREIVEKEGTKVKEMQAPLQVSDYFSFSEVESLIYHCINTQNDFLSAVTILIGGVCCAIGLSRPRRHDMRPSGWVVYFMLCSSKIMSTKTFMFTFIEL